MMLKVKQLRMGMEIPIGPHFPGHEAGAVPFDVVCFGDLKICLIGYFILSSNVIQKHGDASEWKLVLRTLLKTE